jgi:C4-dicarboxylate-specific signal transduction histidine kinase
MSGTLETTLAALLPEEDELPEEIDLQQLREAYTRLRGEKEQLEVRVRKGEQRRRAMIHIMDDMNQLNKKLADQRKAMLHILADYEQDRRRLVRQTERLDNSRRALLHILQDMQQSNLRLENSRKAMIHIMGDLSETTAEMQRREQELRDKQEQLVQAGKLATLGELMTGVAHELNNPLNNIGLFVGNAIDLLDFGKGDKERVLAELHQAMQQVRKAGEIISHLRTFGRAATFSREPVAIKPVIERALSLMREQLRLRQIEVKLDLGPEDPIVIGNAIQLEQAFINLLTNARDALIDAPRKVIFITSTLRQDMLTLTIRDTGVGIPQGLEKRIFDPFFTTKEVGTGTGLGLSITYGIIQEHRGTIWVENPPGEGAAFFIQLPLAEPEAGGVETSHGSDTHSHR